MIVDIADKLLDRLIQLFQYQRNLRKATFAEYIAPAYAAFEELHAAYLESFAGYRRQIEADPSLLRRTSPLLGQIRAETRLSAHVRAKILELAKAGKINQIESFDAAATDGKGREVDDFVSALGVFLLRARANEALVRDATSSGSDYIVSQRFRSSLIEDLEAVIAEDWQHCIDPSAAWPPLTEEEIAEEIEQVAQSHGVAQDDPDRLRKVKVAFALRARDRIVDEMQEGYVAVTSGFLEAKAASLA